MIYRTEALAEALGFHSSDSLENYSNEDLDRLILEEILTRMIRIEREIKELKEEDL